MRIRKIRFYCHILKAGFSRHKFIKQKYSVHILILNNLLISKLRYRLTTVRRYFYKEKCIIIIILIIMIKLIVYI